VLLYDDKITAQQIRPIGATKLKPTFFTSCLRGSAGRKERLFLLSSNLGIGWGGGKGGKDLHKHEEYKQLMLNFTDLKFPAPEFAAIKGQRCFGGLGSQKLYVGEAGYATRWIMMSFC
jgi:hypothetical protein